MQKYHVHSAIGRGRPASAKLKPRITSLLCPRQLHTSQRRNAGEKHEDPVLQGTLHSSLDLHCHRISITLTLLLSNRCGISIPFPRQTPPGSLNRRTKPLPQIRRPGQVPPRQHKHQFPLGPRLWRPRLHTTRLRLPVPAHSWRQCPLLRRQSPRPAKSEKLSPPDQWKHRRTLPRRFSPS